MKSVEDLIPWEMLNYECSNIHTSIYDHWKQMLEDKGLTEHDYLKFIKEFAGFILCNDRRKLVAISELEVSPDYRPDFVVGEDDASYGFTYHLIEIESPHDPVYTNKCNPSAQLSAAMQQIMNWRRWLRGNSEAAKKILPSALFHSSDQPALSFTIIIGRRKDTEEYVHLRNHYADEMNINIRSFDYLTEMLQERRFPYFSNISSAQMVNTSLEVKNELVNPFVEAYSGATWRKLVQSPKFKHYHMIAENIELLLKERTLNSSYQKFMDKWNALPDEKKSVYFERMKHIARL